MDPDQRFHAFKMGGGHRRSHSRSNSISALPSTHDSPPLDPTPSLNLPPRRPASHHHRRSSVSTRRESAELMGVSLPDLPSAHSDDNINLGDKDSIRRRALWALEGKPDLAFSKVEIPDITSHDPFEFPTKPSFPPGSGLNGTGSYAGKRDSFGKMFGSTSSSKDQLGTLVEEEEEEEEDTTDPTEQRKQTPQVATGPSAKVTPRHRPASLNLRPLSLVHGSTVTSAVGSLPTPTLTPTTRPHTRKSLVTATLDDIVLPPSNTPISASHTPSSRRFSCTFGDSGSTPYDLDKKRRSSISYKRSTEPVSRDLFPLPTPEMTPTDHMFSCTSDQDSKQQPLSVADQHFLFRSHHALLSRITELERTLTNRASQSRHLSFSSDASVPSSEPSGEMLQLISDLKAERDELKRDVDGWRQRVADADKHASLLAKRIEAERREAWVARSRLGLLEVENSGLEKSVEAKTSALSQSVAENAVLMRERDEMKDEIMKLSARLKDADAALDECARLRGALEQERARRKELEKVLDDAGLLNTPKLPHTINGSCKRPLLPVKSVGIRPHGLGFQSVDSESSTTDVESVDDSFTKAEFTLDVVTEEDAEFSDEDDDGLAGYEDEEDSDVSFSSPGGSSIGSVDELNIKPGVHPTEILHRSVSPSLPAQSTHETHASLSKTWTFPRGKATTPIKGDDEVDRFFGCLEDIGGSPPLSEEMNQSAFSSAFRSAYDDEMPPFVLPSDVGVVVESMSSRNLDVVPEEEVGVAGAQDDELVGEAIEGGIRFTFNPPPIICVTPPDPCVTPPPEIRITPPLETCMVTPAVRPRAEVSASDRPIFTPELVEDDEDESSLTFVFPPRAQPRHVERVASTPCSSPPSRSSSRTESPPSSIPRAISLRSISPKTPSITFTPSKNVSSRFTTPTGCPAKKILSSIPQPMTPPKFYSTHAKAQTSPKQSQFPNNSTSKPHSKLSMTNDPMPAVRCPGSTQSSGATSKVNSSNNPDSSSRSICEYFYAQDASSLPSIMSNPLAAPLPFQKLSHFMSFSWAPGATAVASYIVPSSSGSPSAKTADPLSSIGSGATRPGQRFVSKARQLEKLRSRLGLEKENGTTPCSMVSACKGCGASDVYL